MRTTAARFRGTCLACHGTIVPGQGIVRLRRRHGRSGWRHEGCGHDWSHRSEPTTLSHSLAETVTELARRSA